MCSVTKVPFNTFILIVMKYPYLTNTANVLTEQKPSKMQQCIKILLFLILN